MAIGPVAEGPKSQQVGHAVALCGVGEPRGDHRGGPRCEGVRCLIGGEEFDRPSGPSPGNLFDVALLVAVVHAEGEKFTQFARVIFVGDAVGLGGGVVVSSGQDGVEVDDHGRTFDTDLQEVVEGALRIQEGLPPAEVFFEFLPGRFGARPGIGQSGPVIEVDQPLGVFGDKVVLQELLKDLGQLALRLNRVVDVPGAQVTDGGRTLLESGIVGDGRFGVSLQRDGRNNAAAAEPHRQLSSRGLG